MKASQHPAKFGGPSLRNNRVIMSLFNSRDKRPRDKRVMLFYEWEPLMVSHHPARFGGHMYCGSGDSAFSG